MKRNEAVINMQVERLKNVLGKLIPFGTCYALIDFPDHSNVGDSAIWLGQIELLLQLTGNKPSYVCTLQNFDADELLKALPSGPIIMHGGGNFGDIWLSHQDFREMIIGRFKDRMIIQLPQSISFSNLASVNKTARIIEQHSNYHLLVRDQNSYEFAQQHFQCSLQLVPDSAFVIGSIKRPIQASKDVFMLLRDDAERAEYDRSLLYTILNSEHADWLEEPYSFNKKTKYSAVFQAIYSGHWNKRDARLTYYQLLAQGRVNRGLKLLSNGRHIITDRLHAHILSTLLDIPHVALDNSYGKVSSYISAWTHIYPAVQTAKTSDEALAKLNLLPKD
ncbi:MAG: polysaccharide pyruvyl transferase family protein [Methylotenera sp.]|uniref:polysaccharide pyruvyl transferase family protein n=1 Tax=Methylotenera sp. TaxID=2051956 RepID=UPI0024874296|nr:polysaccharide pyruvyl transferase family protein [Methylotenera sp.]MDI1309666.1 polysaccharide pyruvyl transferase family protein [Methylotenera sp.]